MGENWLISWMIALGGGLAAVFIGGPSGWSEGAQGLVFLAAAFVGLVVHIWLDERDRRHRNPSGQPR